MADETTAQIAQNTANTAANAASTATSVASAASSSGVLKNNFSEASPKVKEIADSSIKLNEMLGSASDALKSMNDLLRSGNTSSIFDRIGLSVKNTTDLTNLLSIKFLGVRGSFNGIGKDLPINTFTSQINDFIGTLPSGAERANRLGSALKSIGLNPESMGIEAMQKLLLQFALASDNALRMRTSLISASAASGDLGNVFRAAGSDLSSFNNILQLQQDQLNSTQLSLGLQASQVENYYQELLKVPGAMSQVVNGTNLLTASIQLAAGTGMSYSSIVSNLAEAYNQFGVQGEPALLFTSRMGEISRKYGVELSAVSNQLKTTALSFKFFGDNMEATSKIFNTYLGALKNSGLGTTAQIEIISKMTRGIEGMNVAQKAFLSAQTGGPGGLMGAFKIDEMIDAGKLDEVMDKIRQQMNKQFGRIVSLGEAAGDQQAAAQYQKQITILRSGPLGQFAASDAEARKLLAGLRNINEGAIQTTELANDILQSDMDTGNKLLQEQTSILSDIRTNTEALKGNANIAANNVFRNQINPIGATERRRNVETGMQRSANTAQQTSDVMAGRTFALDTSNEVAQRSRNDLSRLLLSLPKDIREVVNRIGDSSKKEEKGQVYSDYMQRADTERREAQNISNRKVREDRLSEIDRQSNVVQQVFTGNIQQNKENENKSQSTQQNIHLNVTGYCLKCKSEIEGSRQEYALNPTTRPNN